MYGWCLRRRRETSLSGRTPDRRHFVAVVVWCYCYCCGRTLINLWASGSGCRGIRVDVRLPASRTRDATIRRDTSFFVIRIRAKHGVLLPGIDPERRVSFSTTVQLLVAAPYGGGSCKFVFWNLSHSLIWPSYGFFRHPPPNSQSSETMVFINYIHSQLMNRFNFG